VQYWKGEADDAWAAYLNATDRWVDTSAVKVKGKGGTQTVDFAPVTSAVFPNPSVRKFGRNPPVYSSPNCICLNGGQGHHPPRRDQFQCPTAGYADPDQTWVVASSTDPACYMTEVPGFDFESFMAFVKSFHKPVSPILTVNMAGTPQEAAAWVHYANKVKGYGVKYWELGNEMNGHWEAGGPWGAKEYAHQFIRFAEAMKAEDPSIVICGPAAKRRLRALQRLRRQDVHPRFRGRTRFAGQGVLRGSDRLPLVSVFHERQPRCDWATVAKMTGLSSDMDKWLANLPETKDVPSSCPNSTRGPRPPSARTWKTDSGWPIPMAST
jgi:hypothetical protein